MWHKKKDLGDKAHRILNDEAFVKAMEEVEGSYINAIKKSKIKDIDGREHLYMAINIIDDVKRHLGIFVEDGKIADAEINHLKRGK